MTVEAQMPLSYGGDGPITFEGTLAGLNVYMRPHEPTAVALHQLKEAGIEASSERSGIRIHVKDLQRLAASEKFELLCDAPLATIWLLANNPPLEDTPVVVTIDSPKTLNLSWPSKTFEHNEPFPASESAALVAAGIALAAHPDAWSKLAGSTTIPLPLAHARIGVERYVELITPAPHQLAKSGIPALFQTSEARYGTPLTYVSAVRRTPGIIWSGPEPSEERIPPPITDARYRLSPHSQEELDKLASEVGVTYGRAVCWSSGLGRRVFALAAIDRLDGWPCTVVTTPSKLWVWHRIAGMLSKTIAITHPRADIQTVMYQSLGDRPDSPASLIFDEVDRLIDKDPGALNRARVYDGFLDSYRIALARKAPEGPEDLKNLLTLVRPSEFRRAYPYMTLYPNDPERRLREHARCYLSARDSSDTPTSGFPSSGTILTHPTNEMKMLLSEILNDRREPAAKAAEAMALVSRGTGSILSPKVPAAASKAKHYIEAGQAVTLLANSEETLAVLEALVPKEANLELVGTGKASTPNLKARNHVIIVDYPQSFSRIDEMVGRLGMPGCPRTVEIVHMEDTTDDRVARISAVRHESAAILDPDRPYGDRELETISSNQSLY